MVTLNKLPTAARLFASAATLIACATLTACAGRAGLPPPRAPLAATPRDAIPRPPRPPADAPIAIDARVHRLDNGLTVVVSPRPAEGLATVVLVDQAAAGRDLRSTRAVTELTAFAMLDATRTDAGVVPDYARHEGYDLRLGLRARALVATATFAADRLDPFLAVLDATVRQPVFRDERIARLLERRVETVAGELATAEGILDDRLPGLLYGEADPRHAPLRRSFTELQRITPRDLRIRHAELLDPAACTLVVVGEVDEARVVARAAEVFGAWAPHPSPPQLAPAQPAEAPVRGVGVVRPLLRPWIGVLERAPPSGHADHPAFLVLSEILGGMFSSRLNLLVRESETLSYGLGATYEASPDGGELRVVTAVDPTQVARFVGTLLGELARVSGAGGGLEARELTIARTRARQLLRARLDSTAGVAGAIVESVLAGLPLDHVERVLARLDRLTKADIEAAAARWIRPDRAPIGVVASREVFESQLTRVPLGPFQVIVPPPRVRR